MAYVALLRGINVGGNSIVEMARLRATFERLGLDRVRTYINSGNVVFTGGAEDRAGLHSLIEQAIAGDFGLAITVLLRTTEEMRAVVEALPPDWRNDGDHQCNVFFSDEFTSPASVGRLPLTEGIEEARFAPGAILCRVPRPLQGRSRLNTLVGTDLYRRMTARNCNTARKLYDLLVAADSS